ncbi:hypothetical protein H3146_04155 [Streptomyces sp. OF3]|uniref:Uncharacterized protein n=1 Tax=Streptomyces alkaliterrae TaxID=2213162 RepID=A0A7W3WHT1_9ACTN|nr:hypothetical protein [Streptomyces alkaliterrae]MBB1252569.1 hypothetical protein [Streptomyces alkaliterrae]
MTTTILARPAAEEERPPLPIRVPGDTLPPPRAGFLEDMEEEDNGRGFEDEPESRRLGTYLHRLVREGDARAAAAGRQVPRTRAQMMERLAAAGGGR